MANADTLTTMGNAQLTVLHAASVASKITGPSNVEALGGGTVQLVAHPPQEGHRIDNNSSAASMPTKAGDVEEASSNTDLLPTRSQAKAVDEEESHSRQTPSQLLNSSQDQHTLPK